MTKWIASFFCFFLVGLLELAIEFSPEWNAVGLSWICIWICVEFVAFAGAGARRRTSLARQPPNREINVVSSTRRCVMHWADHFRFQSPFSLFLSLFLFYSLLLHIQFYNPPPPIPIQNNNSNNNIVTHLYLNYSQIN